MTEVVDRDRHFIPDFRAHIRHVLLQIVESGFRNMNPGERMGGVEQIIRLPAHRARINGTVRRAENGFLVFAHLLQKTERRTQRTGNIHQQFDTEVHFKESESFCHALPESLAHIAPAAFGIGVAVAADPVAVFAAEQLPDGHAPGLSGKVPHRKLKSADTARLTGIAAELLDPAEDLFRIAGIFAENTALEHRRVSATGGIADFSVTDKPLIGVNLDERAALRRTVDVRKTDIRDFQCGWINTGIHSVCSFLYKCYNCFPITIPILSSRRHASKPRLGPEDCPP